jgi:hypothetical protein
VRPGRPSYFAVSAQAPAGTGVNAAEQGGLDADEPNNRDLVLFLADLNAVHFQRDQIRLPAWGNEIAATNHLVSGRLVAALG